MYKPEMTVKRAGLLESERYMRFRLHSEMLCSQSQRNGRKSYERSTDAVCRYPSTLRLRQMRLIGHGTYPCLIQTWPTQAYRAPTAVHEDLVGTRNLCAV